MYVVDDKVKYIDLSQHDGIKQSTRLLEHIASQIWLQLVSGDEVNK